MPANLPGPPPTIREMILLIIAVAVLAAPMLIADYFLKGIP